MQKITNVEELRASILVLKKKQTEEEVLLKEELKITYNSLKPINLLKGILKEFTSGSDFKENILNATIGIATGYLSKKIVTGSTHNPIKKVLGSIIQIGVSSIVSKNVEGIRSTLKHLITSLFNKKESVK